ncbi:MAG: hypothetical protein ABI675_30860 [Chitinophagaceae bacterium]
MIKPLRKRHLQIWIALAFLLPAGTVLSWLVIPNPVPVKLLNPVATELLPVIKYKKDNAQYCINIRTNKENSEWQLEWKNRLSLAVPSAVIYRTSPSPSLGGASRSFTPGGSQLIGRIEARGDYNFTLPPDSSGHDQLRFVLYDFIHQQIIDSINFQP